jgi:hypothetical protein
MEGTQTASYTDSLLQALISRRDWLERSELAKLKESLRGYQTSYTTIYNIFLKKKLINEDPYKQESKISEIEVPDSGNIIEAKRLEQLSLRLSNFDTQLDFLVNFYQLGVDFLNLERIKRIVGLVRYIDWISLTPDSKSANTVAVSEMISQTKSGVDSITLSIIGECLTRLSKTTVAIMAILRDLTIYYKETYKLNVRQSVTQTMSASDAVPANIRKKMSSAMPGVPFYQELIDELIKEDFSSGGIELKEAVLKTVTVVEEKPKSVKPEIDFKTILLDGIIVIGGASTPITEIGAKFDENVNVLKSRRKGLWDLIISLLRDAFSKSHEEVFYEIEYIDAAKGVPVKERINYYYLRDEMNKKAKILTSFIRGPAYHKLAGMADEQIIGYLEKNIKDIQYYHRTLGALDDYFKTNAPSDVRSKIKGVRPELSTMKNSMVKANQLRHEYSAQVEEEEQMKRLGINPSE